ncbi:MAG: hypothetical protein K2X77_02035 [Candidatus Obscuribacterales bacterium]|nr:hypothetical protein [Candidatus Obscuribacterales bacterium]
MSSSTSIDVETTDEVEEQRSVRCRNCENEVTDPSWAIEPHEHTFRNPAGYSFHVLCYGDAPGTFEAGEPTSDASWFAGYQWTFAICAQCHNHLGWWYTGKNRFAGLIATRLIR